MSSRSTTAAGRLRTPGALRLAPGASPKSRYGVLLRFDARFLRIACASVEAEPQHPHAPACHHPTPPSNGENPRKRNEERCSGSSVARSPSCRVWASNSPGCCQRLGRRRRRFILRGRRSTMRKLQLYKPSELVLVRANVGLNQFAKNLYLRANSLPW